MRRTRIICLLTVLAMAVLAAVPAVAWDASTLYNGTRGESVRKLQQKLIDLGFLSGTADGIFGNRTEQAVRDFQKANRLTSDGLAGKQTQAVLFASENPGGQSEPTPPSSGEPGGSSSGSLFSGNYASLQIGASGSRVRIMQEALIKLNYLSGKADGSFGNQTLNAVLAFQRQNNLTADGIAGKKTLTALENASKNGGSSSPEPSEPTPPKTGENEPSSGLFSGNYASLREGDSGDRVRVMQQALIGLEYMSGNADGNFGSATLEAVLAFQKQQRLSQDGIAGKKTLTALEKAAKNGEKYKKPESSGGGSGNEPSPGTTKISAPGVGEIHLLHWFDDVKPSLKNGDRLLIYDPSTGLSWTLQVLSRGRHCDCEPLTKADTDTMVQAFGNKNTWNQKGVYVKLPSGVWTIGSTHDMPHMSGSNKENGFDGHLCVHFLRNMDECKANDPKYGVANQETIRELWKKLSGETISY